MVIRSVDPTAHHQKESGSRFHTTTGRKPVCVAPACFLFGAGGFSDMWVVAGRWREVAQVECDFVCGRWACDARWRSEVTQIGEMRRRRVAQQMLRTLPRIMHDPGGGTELAMRKPNSWVDKLGKSPPSA